MHQYQVFSTRWDSPGVVDEIPVTGDLEFSLPLSDDGECHFSATVPPTAPGVSSWRPSLALPMSGVLVARDGVPVWTGWLAQDRQAGPRTFAFTAYEWGAFFDRVPPLPESWTNADDHRIFRDLVNHAQAVSGQSVAVEVPYSEGAATSDRTINAWDDTTVAREFREVANAAGGPEWFFGAAGTLDAPVRQLVLGDRLGHVEPEAVLEYVEDTSDPRRQELPRMAVLGGLLPYGATVTPPAYRRGGNALTAMRTQDVATASTVAVAIGSGDEKAQLRKAAKADTLLGWGWPRMTRTTAYSDVTIPATLQAHANADLKASAGIPTGYSVVTLDGDPDWTQVPRGSSVRVVLDTDVYGDSRPVGGPDGFVSRVLDMVVRVPASGEAQVEWKTATVLEV